MEADTFEKIKSDAAWIQSTPHSACHTGPLLERWHHCPNTCHLGRVPSARHTVSLRDQSMSFQSCSAQSKHPVMDGTT